VRAQSASLIRLYLLASTDRTVKDGRLSIAARAAGYGAAWRLFRFPAAVPRARQFGAALQKLWCANGRLGYDKPLKPTQYQGSIYDVVPAKRGFLKKAGEWNSEEVTANGRRIQVKLNGTVIVDANLDDIKDPEVLKKHPGLARTKGHIGFLGHGSLVEFRNIAVKELP
jgi:hypothetical protein